MVQAYVTGDWWRVDGAKLRPVAPLQAAVSLGSIPQADPSLPLHQSLSPHGLSGQDRLPGARVVYCSATGATEPANMAYMGRLGLWGPGTPFPEGFMDFKIGVEKGGR